MWPPSGLINSRQLRLRRQRTAASPAVPGRRGCGAPGVQGRRRLCWCLGTICGLPLLLASGMLRHAAFRRNPGLEELCEGGIARAAVLRARQLLAHARQARRSGTLAQVPPLLEGVLNARTHLGRGAVIVDDNVQGQRQVWRGALAEAHRYSLVAPVEEPAVEVHKISKERCNRLPRHVACWRHPLLPARCRARHSLPRQRRRHRHGLPCQTRRELEAFQRRQQWPLVQHTDLQEVDRQEGPGEG
mmetsp:Transcript_97151/g.313739  ORF Transcript_97151/g.313739 Transcript_97151/m.313739 type:complete len:245 (-) Transcript_97151:233-967(-)